MGVIQTEPDSLIYISEKSNGHKIEFLIITNDSIITESYILRLKVQKRLGHDICKIIKDELSITGVSESSDILFGNKRFKKENTDSKFGDFELLYPGFRKLTTKEKLNVCRNKRFIYNPPKQYQDVVKKKINVFQQSDFLLPHHIFFEKLIDEE